jgi:hypothetical protein
MLLWRYDPIWVECNFFFKTDDVTGHFWTKITSFWYYGHIVLSDHWDQEMLRSSTRKRCTDIFGEVWAQFISNNRQSVDCSYIFLVVLFVCFGLLSLLLLLLLLLFLRLFWQQLLQWHVAQTLRYTELCFCVWYPAAQILRVTGSCSTLPCTYRSELTARCRCQTEPCVPG